MFHVSILEKDVTRKEVVDQKSLINSSLRKENIYNKG